MKIALSHVVLFDASRTCIFSQKHGCGLCRRFSGEGANDGCSGGACKGGLEVLYRLREVLRCISKTHRVGSAMLESTDHLTWTKWNGLSY